MDKYFNCFIYLSYLVTTCYFVWSFWCVVVYNCLSIYNCSTVLSFMIYLVWLFYFFIVCSITMYLSPLNGSVVFHRACCHKNTRVTKVIKKRTVDIMSPPHTTNLGYIIVLLMINIVSLLHIYVRVCVCSIQIPGLMR